MTSKNLYKFFLKCEKTPLLYDYEPISSSHEGANILKNIHAIEGNDFQEFFYILCLNRRNKVTGYHLISIGGMTGTVADPRLIIKAAAVSNCTSLILCHNHPSGSIKPSRADEELTQKIKQAAAFFDLKVLDHIILGENEYYSFADEGII